MASALQKTPCCNRNSGALFKRRRVHVHRGVFCRVDAVVHVHRGVFCSADAAIQKFLATGGPTAPFPPELSVRRPKGHRLSLARAAAAPTGPDFRRNRLRRSEMVCSFRFGGACVGVLGGRLLPASSSSLASRRPDVSWRVRRPACRVRTCRRGARCPDRG